MLHTVTTAAVFEAMGMTAKITHAAHSMPTGPLLYDPLVIETQIFPMLLAAFQKDVGTCFLRL